MLDKTRKKLFPEIEIFSFEKFGFIPNCRIVPKTLGVLCSQNVSFLVKVEGGRDLIKIEKRYMEKTPVLKSSEIAC